MSRRHGGNLRELARAAGRSQEEILDFSANINPLGPPEWLRSVISSSVSSLVHYPDPDSSSLAEAVAARYGADPEEVLLGNGSTEILYLLPRALNVSRAIIPVPAYSDYATASELAGLGVETPSLKEDEGFRLNLSSLVSLIHDRDLVFLGQPNNPTGLLFDPEELRSLALRSPSAIFVVDEAFADFVEEMDRLTSRRPRNIIVLCSLTKCYAIPGLRLGCAVGDREIVQRVRKIIPPWSVNRLAQVVGEAALRDLTHLERTRRFVKTQRESLMSRLQSFPPPGLTVYPGSANFLLVRMNGKEMDAPALARRLLQDGIAIRVCDNFDGLDHRFFRIAVRTEEENFRLCASIQAALGTHPTQEPAARLDSLRGAATPSEDAAPPLEGTATRDEGSRPWTTGGEPAKHGRRPALMFCGTGSNAGKSLLTAALCRILLQDGYKVAPFKAQNMALNSFITRSGGEMGRAQVVQAQACRVDPDVRMNPILLKPSSETGAQVILLGEPAGNMDVEQYIRFKPEAFREARRAFDSLASEYDVVVLEGAGSPAEVNLKEHDIVNLAMARYAGAPVLLVGDIDRGGVFASFVGTMEVLAEWERSLVKGFIINKFRGRPDLLNDAIAFTRRHTGRPVLGVVPFLSNLGLPEEDSVTFKSSAPDLSSPQGDCIEIGVVDLPYMSNLTDFDPLRNEPDVHLRIIRSLKDLDHPDAVILPGSKSVIADLAFLRQSGLASEILKLAAQGKTEVVGICGGFQMLGDEIADPDLIESSSERVQALGLLPLSTVFAREKTKKCVTGKHLHSGCTVKGYEIHHGQMDATRLSRLDPADKANSVAGRAGAPFADGRVNAASVAFGGEEASAAKETGLTSAAHGTGLTAADDATALTPTIVREDGEIIGVGLHGGEVWGTYLHGLFDADEFRRWFVDRLRIRRGLPPSGKVCVRYDLEPALERLARVVRESLQIKEIYRIMGLP